MTEFDVIIDRFAREIDSLPRMSQSIFFVSAAGAIYDSHSGTIDNLSLATTFRHALKTISDAIVGEAVPPATHQRRVADTLNIVNSRIPDDLILENSWICLDAAGRIIIDPTYSSGRSVEFALQPSVDIATMNKFGVWQLGSGNQEEDQVAEVMKTNRVVRALSYCRRAIIYLDSSKGNSREVLRETLKILKDLATELS